MLVEPFSSWMAGLGLDHSCAGSRSHAAEALQGHGAAHQARGVGSQSCAKPDALQVGLVAVPLAHRANLVVSELSWPFTYESAVSSASPFVSSRLWGGGQADPAC